MSTVLDALRRLQREREARLAPLEQSATDLISLVAPRRRSVLPWVGAALAALLAVSTVGYWLRPPDGWLNAESRARGSAGPTVALAVDAVELSKSPERVLLGLDDIELDAGPDVAAAPEAVARAENFPDTDSGNPAPDATAPTAPKEPAIEEPLAPLEFPEVRVVQIRWHPDATRREAQLRVADHPELVAHEGDIVAGLLVSRIDPDAVELRLGTETKISLLGR